LPVELTHGENVELVRDYVKKHFVAKGMIADFSIHEDDPNNPHAHILLTMREVSEEGFGKRSDPGMPRPICSSGARPGRRPPTNI